MTSIYLIRHAEAEGNIYRRAHGQYDGQIIGRGLAQIERLKARFENNKIDAVFSSDLSRAQATASAICEPHNLPLNTTEQLREVGMGIWEDMAWGDIEYTDPENNRYFSVDPAQWQVEGGEYYCRVQERMTDCIEEIARQHKGGTVAVLSHGLAIRLFICGILGLPSDEIKQVPYFDNTSVTLLLYDNGGFTIEYKGDNSHLNEETSTFAHQNWWRGDKKPGYENLRYMPIDVKRDARLLELYREEFGTERVAGKEYTAFLGEEQVGILGLDGGNGRHGENSEFGIRNSELSAVNDNESAADNRNTGWIDYIFVEPVLRRRNFGVQLLGQAISYFRSLGREYLRISIPRDNTETGFFRKYDFVDLINNDSHRVMEKFIRNW